MLVPFIYQKCLEDTKAESEVEDSNEDLESEVEEYTPELLADLELVIKNDYQFSDRFPDRVIESMSTVISDFLYYANKPPEDVVVKLRPYRESIRELASENVTLDEKRCILIEEGEKFLRLIIQTRMIDAYGSTKRESSSERESSAERENSSDRETSDESENSPSSVRSTDEPRKRKMQYHNNFQNQKRKNFQDQSMRKTDFESEAYRLIEMLKKQCSSLNSQNNDDNNDVVKSINEQTSTDGETTSENRPLVNNTGKAFIKVLLKPDGSTEEVEPFEKRSIEKAMYTCSLCQGKFMHHHHMVRHQKTKHENHNFTCFVCHKAFTRKDILKRHMNSHPRIHI